MPYDKAVDSAALDAGLTAIANAIREKTGSSDALAFPDAMAAAIAAIEGGGAGEGILMAGGTIVPVEDTNEVVLSHGLGVIPNFVCIFRQKFSMATKGTVNHMVLTPPNGQYGSDVSNVAATTQTQAYYQARSYYRVNFTTLSTSASEAITKDPYYIADENSVRFFGTNYNDYSDYSQFEASTYYWFAVYNPSIENWGDF